jgi:hypothetical protein
VQALVDDKFATPDSIWMTAASTDTGSFYKKLIKNLLSQSRQGAGYGYLALYFDKPKDCVFEAYSQKSGRVTAIDYWGYQINDDKYDKGATLPPFADNFRARLLLNPDGTVLRESNGDVLLEKFHWWFNGDTEDILPAS